ncbi:hypothetical protein Tco_0601759 [Tanacetum coccineum]
MKAVQVRNDMGLSIYSNVAVGGTGYFWKGGYGKITEKGTIRKLPNRILKNVDHKFQSNATISTASNLTDNPTCKEIITYLLEKASSDESTKRHLKDGSL